jgi:twitching motility protein PilT
LREDPDVLYVSELRDLETLSLTLSLADTGHLVFTTLNVPSASAAVQRLVDAFPEAQREAIRGVLVRNLKAVVAQRIVPRGHQSAAFRQRNPDRHAPRPANDAWKATPT